MRILIFIALLCVAVQGRGQIYINSYAFATVSTDLLLDSFPGAQNALSLRLLDKDYTGNCITVRRINGDTSNIGFTNNYLDTVSLKTFCGTASSDTCWVRRWYDQSGNNNNATQTTNASQPQILRGGVIFRDNSEVAFRFDGVDDWMNSNVAFAANDYTYYSVGRVITPATTTLHGIYGIRGTSNQRFYWGFFSQTAAYSFATGDGFPDATVSSASVDFVIYTNWIESTSSMNIALNGGSIANVTNTSDAGIVGFNFFIGSLRGSDNNTPSAGLYFDGAIKEIIGYNSDKSSDRTLVRNNINNFYSIY